LRVDHSNAHQPVTTAPSLVHQRLAVVAGRRAVHRLSALRTRLGSASTGKHRCRPLSFGVPQMLTRIIRRLRTPRVQAGSSGRGRRRTLTTGLTRPVSKAVGSHRTRRTINFPTSAGDFLWHNPTKVVGWRTTLSQRDTSETTHQRPRRHLDRTIQTINILLFPKHSKPEHHMGGLRS
jgi:hypothetical protein